MGQPQLFFDDAANWYCDSDPDYGFDNVDPFYGSDKHLALIRGRVMSDRLKCGGATEAAREVGRILMRKGIRPQ
jgi:hypothetical protein